MGYKQLLCFGILLLTLFAFGQTSKTKGFINPTGTYKLPYLIEGDNVYGPFGEVRVKLLSENKIIVSLFICRGPSNYNNGSFIDTLTYLNNTAVHKTPDSDTSCRIILTFKKDRVHIEQFQENINDGCEFGQGVFADGEYHKVSNKTPLIEDVGYEYFPIDKFIKKHKPRTRINKSKH